MDTRQQPCFLAVAMDWWDIADALRRCGVPEGDPVLDVWREAAWCHLLFGRGYHALALRHLLAAAERITRGLAVEAPADTGEDAVRVAADVFARLRAFVVARYPAAFRRPAA